ncbi:MAG: LuxR family transcriptional regulator [Methylococcales bacterium]|nr:LuxR family transcriptional regulator [Methylococcales bacterium]
MAITPWLEEQLQALLTAQNQQDLLQHLVKTAELLGFDYCAFGFRAPYPLTAPKTLLLNNYPIAWQQRYATNHYLAQDPVMQHGLRSTSPLAWSGREQSASPFWEDALAHGIGYGWSQSYCNKQNFSGMLSLARSLESIGAKELAEKEPILSWLTQVAYAGFYPFMASKLTLALDITLTEREKEILRWTADGKTVEQIAQIINVGKRTVNFHITQVLDKLGAANKTAATVQAVLLGLI